MERSPKQRFLEQERLQLNYEIEAKKPSDLPWLISAIALMGVVLIVVTVTFLSLPAHEGKLHVSGHVLQR